MDAMIHMITRLLGPLKRRVMLTIGRAVLTLIDDAGGIQRVQLTALEGETLDRVERFMEYGFTSHPHPGAEAVLAAVAGDRAHGLIVAVEDRRYRLAGLAGGEVALHDDLGQRIHLTRSGIVIDTPGNLTVAAGGDIAITAAGRIEIAATRIDLN